MFAVPKNGRHRKNDTLSQDQWQYTYKDHAQAALYCFSLLLKILILHFHACQLYISLLVRSTPAESESYASQRTSVVHDLRDPY